MRNLIANWRERRFQKRVANNDPVAVQEMIRRECSWKTSKPRSIRSTDETERAARALRNAIRVCF